MTEFFVFVACFFFVIHLPVILKFAFKTFIVMFNITFYGVLAFMLMTIVMR